jgi:hypothetical protein
MFAMSNPYDQNPEPNPYGQDPNQGGMPPYGQNPNQGGMPPYGQNPYQGGYGVAPQPHPQGTTVLVLGILGILVCGICAIIALVLGNRALKEIDANPAAYSNRQNVVIGRILGIVGVILWALGIIAYAIFIFAAIGSANS